MIASYPSYKATTLFHGSVHKDIARYVGRGECEGPDGDPDSGALPRLTHALRGAVKVFLRCFKILSQDFGAAMSHGE